ncbi:hypothetical protein [Ruegeria jejuensis]|uniref:hypothetical protein n=1 Tax=Ruegeria jejuensis TaxID=3233338 RepID=UPI00355AD48B
MQTPTGIDRYYARTCAQSISESITKFITLEGVDDDFAQAMAKTHRQEAWEQIEKLAELFGAELVEAEPESEPLDAEAIEAREASIEQAIIDAGRGHLVGS